MEGELEGAADSVVGIGDDSCTKENTSIRVGLSSLTSADNSGARTSMCLSAGMLMG